MEKPYNFSGNKRPDHIPPPKTRNLTVGTGSGRRGALDAQRTKNWGGAFGGRGRRGRGLWGSVGAVQKRGEAEGG